VAIDLDHGCGRASPVDRPAFAACHLPYAGAVPGCSRIPGPDCCLRPTPPGSARSIPYGFTFRRGRVHARYGLQLCFSSLRRPDLAERRRLTTGLLWRLARAGLTLACRSVLILGTPSKRCSLAGADWRGYSTNYPSIERPFFVYSRPLTPIRSVDPGSDVRVHAARRSAVDTDQWVSRSHSSSSGPRALVSLVQSYPDPSPVTYVAARRTTASSWGDWHGSWTAWPAVLRQIKSTIPNTEL
jgi:hypothetical protein